MKPNNILSVSWINNLFFQRLLFSVFFIFSGSVLAVSPGSDLFFDSSSTQVELGTVNPEIVIRQRPVEIGIEEFSEEDSLLHLNLFLDVELVAVLDHIEEDALGNHAWIGTIEGIDDSSVSLVMNNGKLSGSVNLQDVCYHIRHISNQLHVIREIDVAVLEETVNELSQEIFTEYPGLQLYEQFQSQVPAISLPLVGQILGVEEQQVLELVNQERAVRGLTLLAADELLTNAARGHSQDMSQNNYFSHTGLNGSSPGQRIAATGYSFNTWGENIAAGYTSAASVMNGWMNSSGHRANILKSNFCDIGIGYVAAGRLWTQTFGRKQGVSTCPPVDDTNNPTTPNPPTTPETTSKLENGAAKNFSLSRNQTIEFVVQLPANVNNFKVTINGSGDADLYVKKAKINWPSDSGQHNSSNFKSPWLNGSNESVSFNSPGQATWHVLIHGYSAGAGSIKATWQLNTSNNGNGGANDNPNLLTNGSEKSFSLSRHQILEYEINLPANARNLQVIITGSGDADLYVKKAPINWPGDSGQQFQTEFQAPWINGSNESVFFPNPASGNWHVLIYGYQAAEGKIRAFWQ
jgi:uncharacterized protein YkwD